ncbi:hypothetical protein [Niveibacterium sp. SC-1]|uniref:hypothetical protein n=1 Tax=Niveibacterium sp. SC-1 TaxID=3135646 RepID=UPI00311D8D4D
MATDPPEALVGSGFEPGSRAGLESGFERGFDIDNAVLGGELPGAVQALIQQAGQIRGQVPLALLLLEQAHALAPHHPATLIAIYRFHFYGNRISEARDVALRALALAQRELGLAARWQEVQRDVRFDDLTPLPRFFLFALKAYAYLSLRLRELDEGRAVIERLAVLDPRDRVGHRVLATVLAGMGREDVGYEDCPDIAVPAAALVGGAQP